MRMESVILETQNFLATVKKKTMNHQVEKLSFMITFTELSFRSLGRGKFVKSEISCLQN